jgi:hypothetical protein
MGISPLDECGMPRDFGILVDYVSQVDGDNSDNIDEQWWWPTVGVLWIATCCTDIGANVCIESNYQIITHEVTRDNRFTETHVFILHQHGEIDLYTPCSRPTVNFMIEGRNHNEELLAWLPNVEMDCELVESICT